LARTYPIAFSIKGKTWVNNHAHVLKFDDIENQKFIEYYLNSIRLDPYISGMAQPKLNQSMLNSIVIPLPKSLAEQRAIVAYIGSATAKLDGLRATAERTIALLKERRAALIAAAVTCKIKVPQAA